MSMTLTAQAMQIKVGNPIRKLVLLKLADQANDKGECWPSYASVAEAAECSKRAAMIHIEWLAQHGFLRIEQRKISGRQNLTNLYHLTLSEGNADTGAHSESDALGSEPDAPHSESDALGSEPRSPGGSESAAPEPINKNQSMNHTTTDVVVTHADAPPNKTAKQPEKPKRQNRHAADLALLAEYGVSGQLAEDHLQIRKAKRQPLTRTAMSILQAEAAKAGLTVAQALTHAVGAGWASFRAEYLQNRSTGTRRNNINQIPTHTVGGAFAAKDVF